MPRASIQAQGVLGWIASSATFHFFHDGHTPASHSSVERVAHHNLTLLQREIKLHLHHSALHHAHDPPPTCSRILMPASISRPQSSNQSTQSTPDWAYSPNTILRAQASSRPLQLSQPTSSSAHAADCHGSWDHRTEVGHSPLDSPQSPVGPPLGVASMCLLPPKSDPSLSHRTSSRCRCPGSWHQGTCG